MGLSLMSARGLFPLVGGGIARPRGGARSRPLTANETWNKTEGFPAIEAVGM
jgi:hypothetical protein